MNRIAEVIINSSARQLGKIFHYIIPNDILEKIRIGQLVSVPFGKSNKDTKGFVIGVIQKSEFTELKSIKKVVVEESLFKKELIKLAFWMSSKYLCSVSECIRVMLPPMNLLETKETVLEVEPLKSYKDFLDLIDSKVIKGTKQIEILKYMKESKKYKAVQILETCSTNLSVLRILEKKGLISIKEKVISKDLLKYKDPMADRETARTNAFVPNIYQKKAIEKISELINKNQPAEVLVHGVTGSGKTEVYLQIISKAIEQGKQAIVLVPEISLTPQMIQRFVGRFGQNVAIMHSRLSHGERSNQWCKIKHGLVRVVVGVRSAIFAPFSNLGLIIIDEEHEHTYKSEKTPRYHTKEVAYKRCELENSVLVLGSATPSIETYHKALEGKMGYIELPERANDSKLPDVKIVDMRRELDAGNKSIFSRSLYNAVKENIEKNNQTILFLNRRGYSSFVLCRNCGFVAKCRYCNISLTYHLHGERLVCHYCGYNRINFKVCPSCKSENIRHFGVGTQKLEEEVKRLFPKASVLRMDLDTTSRKNSHEQILKKFRDENINILIGTQMIAKGHDFPNVTLVGVISADLMLNMEDFRSTEKTFQLLTQVAGRAGRAEKEGKVIIQTYEVDNFSILTARDQDYIGFYKQEIVLREELKYPPFCDIVLVLITGEDEVKVKQISEEIEKNIRKELLEYQDKILILKTVPAPISRIKSKFRWRIIIKCNMSDALRKKMNELIKQESIRVEKYCVIGVDINPLSML